MSSQGQSSSPLPPSRASTPASSNSEGPYSWPCSCGKGDGTGKYIECDNPDCRVGWYHWECVQVTKEPAGTWLCPSCSPNAAFYIKQLVKTRATPPLIPDSRTVATPTFSKGKEREPEIKKKEVAKKGIAVKKPAPEKPKPKWKGWVETSSSDEEETELTSKPGKSATPTSSRKKEHEPQTNDKNIAKKGVAVKKSAPENPKPKWRGWVELESDDEEEYKKQVDAKWMEDIIEGNRTRASRANETASRRLRARSKPMDKSKKAVETGSEEEEEMDEEESIYQEEDEEDEDEDEDENENDDEEKNEEEEDENEASVSEKASIHEISSDDEEVTDGHEDSEDAMDVDGVPDHDDEESWSGLSDSPSNSEEERYISPDRAQRNVTSDRNDGKSASEAEAEDLEGSIDMDISQDESGEASGSDGSNLSEYLDDGDASASSEVPTRAPNSRDAADSSSLSPEPTPITNPAGPSAASPQDPFPASDDSMDIDEESEAQDNQHQVYPTVYPAVESNDDAALYQHLGKDWRYFRKSAIRSTLPRLG